MKYLISFVMILGLGMGIFAQTADEIIRQMDDNQTFDAVAMTGRMEISDSFGQNISEFNSWSQGEDNLLIEFTSEYEAGQKILRQDDKIILYFPEAEETIILQGAALKQSLLGSDVSYEDMAGERTTLDDYDALLMGEENLGGRTVWKIQLTAKEGNFNVPYAKRVVYVDQETFLAIKGEMYSLSGSKIKEMESSDIRLVGENYVAFRTVIRDLLRGNSQTQLIIEEIELDPSLSSSFFSLRSLTR